MHIFIDFHHTLSQISTSNTQASFIGRSISSLDVPCVRMFQTVVMGTLCTLFYHYDPVFVSCGFEPLHEESILPSLFDVRVVVFVRDNAG
jgi:hypothetical protein